jgi:hypothetical protein
VGAGALALGLGGLIVQSVSDTPPGTGPGKNKPATAGAKLEKHVHGLLAEHPSQKPTTGTGSTPSPNVKTEGTRTPSPLTGGAAPVPSCVRKGIDRTEEALAVDEKMPYKGDHAYLVVLPHQGDQQRVDAYVVDPSCVSGEKSGPADVLGKHTYTRR